MGTFVPMVELDPSDPRDRRHLRTQRLLQRVGHPLAWRLAGVLHRRRLRRG